MLAAGTLATGAVAGAVEGFAGAATTTVGATVAGVGALERQFWLQSVAGATHLERFGISLASQVGINVTQIFVCS